MSDYLEMVGRMWRALPEGPRFLAAEYDGGFFTDQKLKHGDEITEVYMDGPLYVVTDVSKVVDNDWWEIGYKIKEPDCRCAEEVSDE